ncbi:hypothetical protein [Prevotella sp.]|uniref:hypothetical protein n=1 Tax=Prevotella sp. TaxID=59823 RepID=UPI003DA2CDC5
MKLNEGGKLYCVNTTADLDLLKSLHVKEVSDTLDLSFESTSAKRMYGYKFEQDSDLKSLKLKINPYLVFFENRITNENLALNKGLCVMYPSTLVTGEIDSHVKFVGNSGALLYTLSQRNHRSSYSVDQIISIFAAIYSGTNTKASFPKIIRIIELLITDLFLIIE